MKKILVMVLVGVIGMSALAGCGKSEEEKAMDEIAEHLRDEAAADGVDIDEMLEEDAAKYSAELEAGNQAIYDRNTFIEQLKNNEMAVLKEQYEIYSNATDSETAKKAGEEFNKAYDEYLEAAIGEHIDDEYSAAEQLRLNDIHKMKITDIELQTRVNYLNNCYGKDYNKIQFFTDNKENISILMWNEADDGTVSNISLVYPDSTVITPDLSSISEPVQNVDFFILNNELIVTGDFENWAYEFTIDNPIGNAIGALGELPEYPERDYEYSTELWENTIEEYNSKME
jgi:hypothetical protein